MARDLDCPHCWGLGEVVRESTHRNGSLFSWPCVDCLPPLVKVAIRTNPHFGRMAKNARKMLATQKETT